jgi:hypothetical protein
MYSNDLNMTQSTAVLARPVTKRAIEMPFVDSTDIAILTANRKVLRVKRWYTLKKIESQE